MKINKRYISSDYFWLYIIFLLLAIKLTFSYLIVEHSYWIRHLPNNFEAYNIFGAPKNLTKNVEYLIIPILLTYILANFKYLGRLKSTFLLSSTLFFLNIITYFLTEAKFLESIELTLKIVSPIYLFLGLVIFYTKTDFNIKKLLNYIIYYCLFLILIGILFLEISVNRKIEQWPIFFSNIHTHSYIVATLFISISYAIFKRKNTINLLVFFLISFAILYVGYSVRTALLLYLTFIIAALFLRSNFFKYLWVKIIVYLPLILLTFFLIIDIDIDEFSSGRITMYRDKFEMIGDYSFTELLFGRGFESDLVATKKWWYDEKGSHSDYITYVVENGFIYLLMFLTLIFSVIPIKKSLNLLFASLIIGYLLTSLISNGIAARPLAGYVFFSVIAYFYITTFISNKESKC